MRIGDFDSTWLNYDRRDGPALVEEFKEPIKVEENRPNWLLKVGDENWTNRLIEAEVTFTDDGESGLRMRVAHQAYKRRYERARVALWVGYGTKLIPYYLGRLESAKDHKSGLFSEIESHGLGSQMGGRFFRGRVSWAKWPLKVAWWDLVGRFGADPDRFEWLVEAAELLESDMGGFGLEHTMLEAEQTILDPFGITAYDQLGGLRIVQRKPTLDSVTRASLGIILEEKHYYKDGFDFSDSSRNHYSGVVVLRRSEKFAGGGKAGQGPGMVRTAEGSWVPQSFYGSNAEQLALGWDRPYEQASEYAVYYEEPVGETSRFNIHRGRVDMVADFPGDQAGAQREAERRAAAHTQGIGTFTLDCPPLDLALHDHFGVEQVEEQRDQDMFRQLDWTSIGQLDKVLYACDPKQTILNIGPGIFRMNVTGDATERDRTTIRAAGPRIVIDLHIPNQDADPEGNPPEPPDTGSGDPTIANRRVLTGTDTVVDDEGNFVVADGQDTTR